MEDNRILDIVGLYCQIAAILLKQVVPPFGCCRRGSRTIFSSLLLLFFCIVLLVLKGLTNIDLTEFNFLRQNNVAYFVNDDVSLRCSG